MWQATEPLHAVCYFHPLPTDELKAAGLRGWWMSYFAGRFAPAGAIGAGPAAAMAFGFSARMVSRSLPDAWHYVAPETVVDARIRSAATALAETLDDTPGSVVERLGELLTAAVDACDFGGRPLAAAWNSVADGRTGWERVWVMTSVLREHRGDGHVAAATALGLTGLETTITHIASGGMTRALIQKNRGWTDEQWTSAEESLRNRGILDGAALTDEGRAIRDTLELNTDLLAARPLARMSQDDVAELVAIGAPLSRSVIDRGVVPMPNPVGVARP